MATTSTKRKRSLSVEAQTTTSPPSKKLDVYSRTLATSTKGRGSLSGWTACPLCNGKQKKYALGRGISMHIQQCHTPWKPGKAELARRERLRRRIEGVVYRAFKECNKLSIITDDILGDVTAVKESETPNQYKERLLRNFLGDTIWDRDGKSRPISYTPDEVETQKWSMKLLEIVRKLEQSCSGKDDGVKGSSKEVDKSFLMIGFDRDGKESKIYKKSLPPFIKAASDGNLELLKQMVEEVSAKSSFPCHHETSVKKLLEMKDRNGSNGEHWSAGNGHLMCLQYLMDLSTNISDKNSEATLTDNRRKRRDGKTTLHYASRNGQTEIIQFLLSASNKYDVDVLSGDGTTPLHMAFYGGHLEAIKCLIDNKAKIYKKNEWECGIGHWIALSIQTDNERLVDILNYMKELVDGKSYRIFGLVQKQGHSAIHKAAQKLNITVLKWLAEEAASWTPEQQNAAGGEDACGNKPSTIWLQMGGDKTFSAWIIDKCGW